MAKTLITREDVAARAGVSPVTVSRCFTNPDTVAPKRRAHVLAVAADLGYHPNRGASVMRAGATGRLVLVERRLQPGKEWENNRLYDYLFKSIYHGVLRGLAESMYAMAYVQVNDDDQLRETLQRQPMDGIIGMNFEFPEELGPIIDAGIPYVIAHNARSLEGYNRCYTDNFQGGRLAGAYLRETGHRRVAYITYAPDSIRTHRDRRDGFRAGLGEERLALEIDPGLRGKLGGLKAAEIILEHLSTGQTLDAVAVLNDETAVFLIQALTARGLRVPEDLSVIGYDNNPSSQFLPFDLATVDLNLETLYCQAVGLLIHSIRSGEPVSQGLSPRLVPGNSVLDRSGS